MVVESPTVVVIAKAVKPIKCHEPSPPRAEVKSKVNVRSESAEHVHELGHDRCSPECAVPAATDTEDCLRFEADEVSPLWDSSTETVILDSPEVTESSRDQDPDSPEVMGSSGDPDSPEAVAFNSGLETFPPKLLGESTGEACSSAVTESSPPGHTHTFICESPIPVCGSASGMTRPAGSESREWVGSDFVAVICGPQTGWTYILFRRNSREESLF